MSVITERRLAALFGIGRQGTENVARIADRLGFQGQPRDLLSRDFESNFGGEIVFIDIADPHVTLTDTEFDRLTRLDAVARERGVSIVAHSGRNNLDAVAACLSGADVTLLCDADIDDWVLAVAFADQTTKIFAEGTKEDESIRLQRLSDEVARIAQVLASLTRQQTQTRDYTGFREAAAGFRTETAPDVVVNAEDVRGIVRLRRMRERFFPADLFADPAWDMLLDLMAARIERSAIAVSSLCIAAAVPPTTALRWIKNMTEGGLFVRVADPDDGRRVFITLSEPTAAAMQNYLSAAKAQGGLAI